MTHRSSQTRLIASRFDSSLASSRAGHLRATLRRSQTHDPPFWKYRRYTRPRGDDDDSLASW